MVNKCELVIKIVICNKRKWLALSRLNQKVLDEGGTPGNYVFRDPHASRSKADTDITSWHGAWKPRIALLRKTAGRKVLPMVMRE